MSDIKNISKIDFETYYQSQKDDAGEEVGIWASNMISNFTQYVAQFEKHMKIVDVGCYTGVGLLSIQKLGYTNVFGIDLVEENIKSAKKRGLSVIQADMHNLDFLQENEFDVLFMNHAIEHSIDPVTVLNNCFRISKHGLIVFPLERNKNERCNPPHYYTFKNENDVYEVIEKSDVCYTKEKLIISPITKGQEFFLEWSKP